MRLPVTLLLLGFAATPIGLAEDVPSADHEAGILADEYAQDQITELSSANRALFTNGNLDSITSPSKLVYNFSQKGGLKEFTGTVEVNINRIHANGRKDLTFRYLKGRNKVRFSPQYGVRSNPLFMLFFERDTRKMQTITGGNALFFRNRIRHALAASDAKPVKFNFRGELVDGQQIEIRPFFDTTLAERFPKYKQKTYNILLSASVPGTIYQLRSFVPKRGGVDGSLSDDVLVFAEVLPL